MDKYNHVTTGTHERSLPKALRGAAMLRESLFLNVPSLQLLGTGRHIRVKVN